MRILLTVHQFFPEYFSGTEVLTFSVAKELLIRGHKVFVFAGFPAKQQLPDEERFDSYNIEGIEVHRFHHAFTPMGQQHVLSEIEYDNHLSAHFFAHLLDTIRPDVVHFFHFSRLGISLIDVTRQKAVPAYYTPTDFWSICPTSQLLLCNGNICDGPTKRGGNCIKHVATLTHWRRLATMVKYLPNSVVDCISLIANSDVEFKFPFRKDISALSQRPSFNINRLNALNGIVSPTQLMTDVLMRNGVDERLIVQSAYGIEISGLDAVQRQFDLAKPLIIGYIGTLAPHKGCQILIEAFLSLKNKNAKLKIYGNLFDFKEFVAGLKERTAKCENIEFLGTFPNAQIAEIFAGIDVLVVPSVWYENTPLVIYSALAAKCPVVASNFPGMSEVVRDDWNGLTFPPGDVEALMQCLQRLQLTPRLLEQLSKNCQKPKSIATYVDELLDFYTRTTRLPLHAPPPREIIESYQPSQRHGYISGWAVVASEQPKSIRLFSGGREVAKAHRMHPRPDVRDGLKDAEYAVNGVNFGFTIALHECISPAEAVLVVEGRHGAHEIPFKNLLIGQLTAVTHKILIGIDKAEFSGVNKKGLAH